LHLNANFYVKSLSLLGVNITSMIERWPGSRVPLVGST